MWVAIGNGDTYQIAYSYDGINWTGTGTGIFDECNGIAWNGTLWVAVGNPVSPITSNATIAYSSDGKMWMPVTNSRTNNFYQGNDVAWNGSLWVAVGGNDEYRSSPVATSIDGITWTNQTFEDMIPYGIAWNGSVWVAVGQDASGVGTSNIAYSPDGISWSSTSPPITKVQTIVDESALNKSLSKTKTYINEILSGYFPTQVHTGSEDTLIEKDYVQDVEFCSKYNNRIPTIIGTNNDGSYEYGNCTNYCSMNGYPNATYYNSVTNTCI
jgi:hypothetical protein